MIDTTNESILVRRDQFDISPIIHKPTDAAFTPYSGGPYSGTFCLGQLGNDPPGPHDPDHVERMMRELWAEYVTENWDLFASK